MKQEMNPSYFRLEGPTPETSELSRCVGREQAPNRETTSRSLEHWLSRQTHPHGARLRAELPPSLHKSLISPNLCLHL